MDVGVGTCPHQVLAATLTLFQPGGTDYAHSILMSPPSFESHRRAWYVTNKHEPQILKIFLLCFCLIFYPTVWNSKIKYQPTCTILIGRITQRLFKLNSPKWFVIWLQINKRNSFRSMHSLVQLQFFITQIKLWNDYVPIWFYLIVIDFMAVRLTVVIIL